MPTSSTVKLNTPPAEDCESWSETWSAKTQNIHTGSGETDKEINKFPSLLRKACWPQDLIRYHSSKLYFQPILFHSELYLFVSPD
jgi:hypothetical protein